LGSLAGQVDPLGGVQRVLNAFWSDLKGGIEELLQAMRSGVIPRVILRHRRENPILGPEREVVLPYGFDHFGYFGVDRAVGLAPHLSKDEQDWNILFREFAYKTRL